MCLGLVFWCLLYSCSPATRGWQKLTMNRCIFGRWFHQLHLGSCWALGFSFQTWLIENVLEKNLIADMQHSKICFWSSCSACHRCGENTSFIWVGAELPPSRQFQGFTAMRLYGFHLWWCEQMLKECFAPLYLLGIVQGLAQLLHDFCNAVEFASLECPDFSLWPTRENQFSFFKSVEGLQIWSWTSLTYWGFFYASVSVAMEIITPLTWVLSIYMCVCIFFFNMYTLHKTGRAVPAFFSWK